MLYATMTEEISKTHFKYSKFHDLYSYRQLFGSETRSSETQQLFLPAIEFYLPAGKIISCEYSLFSEAFHLSLLLYVNLFMNNLSNELMQGRCANENNFL